MPIHWYPGHMLTARKNAAETMDKIDVVIEVLDARVPFSSLNPMVEQLRKARQRPALKLLNKADVADPQRTRQWLDFYNAQPGTKAVAVSAKSPGEIGRVPAYCLELAPTRTTVLKPLRMMIMGIPNVGKSTIMNALLKRKVAPVGDEPAVTKMQKRLALNDKQVLVDTPGMMWPRIEQQAAFKLAQTHSIGVNAYDPIEVAVELGGYLLSDYPQLVAKRFGPPPEGSDGNVLLRHVAERRGLVLKGGELDLEKAALALLNDFRAGTLGRITLETPEQVAQRTPVTP